MKGRRKPGASGKLLPAATASLANPRLSLWCRNRLSRGQTFASSGHITSCHEDSGPSSISLIQPTITLSAPSRNASEPCLKPLAASLASTPHLPAWSPLLNTSKAGKRGLKAAMFAPSSESKDVAPSTISVSNIKVALLDNLSLVTRTFRSVRASHRSPRTAATGCLLTSPTSKEMTKPRLRMRLALARVPE